MYSSGTRTVIPVCFLLAEGPGDGSVEVTPFYREAQYYKDQHYNDHLLVTETEAQEGRKMTRS